MNSSLNIAAKAISAAANAAAKTAASNDANDTSSKMPFTPFTQFTQDPPLFDYNEYDDTSVNPNAATGPTGAENTAAEPTNNPATAITPS
jgi:hypothetical protein